MAASKTLVIALKGTGESQIIQVQQSDMQQLLARAKSALGIVADAHLEDDDGVIVCSDEFSVKSLAALKAGGTYSLVMHDPRPEVTEEKTPSHVGEGLLTGVSRGLSSTITGARGFYTKTKEGAETRDVKGFLKGFGAGTLDLAQGVVGGSAGLVTSTVEGLRNTPEALQAHMGQESGGGATEQGQRKLLESNLREDEKDPAHVGEGLLNGVSALGRGVWGGVKDLADKPLDGVREGGAAGFIKGLGQGVAGATSKTLTGTLDAVGVVAVGVQNTAGTVTKAVEAHMEKSSASADASADVSAEQIEKAADEEKAPAHIGEGLFTGVSRGWSSTMSGAKDFYNKTKSGAETGDVRGFFKGFGAGTMDLAQGVVGGSADLVSSTVEGLRNTPEAVQARMGPEASAGAAAEGQPKMLESILKEDEKAPAHIGQGLLTGASAIGRGMWGGVLDLGDKTRVGAREGGAAGLVRGLGQGVVGATSKTMSGALDAVSVVAAGAKNTGGAVSQALGEAQAPRAGSESASSGQGVAESEMAGYGAVRAPSITTSGYPLY